MGNPLEKVNEALAIINEEMDIVEPDGTLHPATGRRVKVQVLINRADDRFRRPLGEPNYQLGDPLEHALNLEVPEAEDSAILERVWHELNTETPTGYGNLDTAHIDVYHQMYPSLSVGDVVIIEDRVYTVESTGWSKLELTREVI